MSADTPSDGSAVESPVETDEAGEPLLEVRNLKRYFTEGDGFLDQLMGDTSHVHAVDGVDLTIREGETVAVGGESGCGKARLGRSILNLHKPTDGTVRFKGEDITGLSKKKMRPYRREMQMIFQDPLASLNPRQTVGDILRAPLEVHGIGEDKEDRTERAEDLIERVGLKASHLNRHPHQFSGGQQQRIGLARALSLEPDLLIADEPVSALDVSVQAQVLNLLDELQEELGLSMMFIAHDLSVVRLISDRVAVMYLGEVVETAPTDELFENPQHPYTKSLLSAVPRIAPEQRGDRTVLEGTVPSPINPPSGCRFHTRCPVVIPPDDWSGSQEAFRSAFMFRNRLLNDEIDPEAVRIRLQTEDDERIRERLIDTALPGEADDLPEDAREAIETATQTLVAGNEQEAKSIARQAFHSPCEETPQSHDVDEDHVATCHRVDPDATGQQIWSESSTHD